MSRRHPITTTTVESAKLPDPAEISLGYVKDMLAAREPGLPLTGRVVLVRGVHVDRYSGVAYVSQEAWDRYCELPPGERRAPTSKPGETT